MGEICASIGTGYGVEVELAYVRRYPCTVNAPAAAARVARVAAGVVGA